MIDARHGRPDPILTVETVRADYEAAIEEDDVVRPDSRDGPAVTLDQPAPSRGRWHPPRLLLDHPNQRLVTHRAAAPRSYGVTVATVCPNPSHDFLDRERCRWCGHELVGRPNALERQPAPGLLHPAPSTPRIPRSPKGGHR